MEKYASVPTSDNSSAEALLNKGARNSLDTDSVEDFSSHHKPRSWYRRNERTLITGIVVFLANMTICVVYTHWLTSQYSHFKPTYPWSPAREVVSYEQREWDLVHLHLPNGSINPEKPGHFGGPPTPALVAEWKNLLQHQNFRLQKEEYGPFADDPNLVQLADGSGYMATVAVYHGLHCTKRLHHYLYADDYYPDMSADDKQRLMFHAEHCIDWLRQYIQCNADTTIIPYFWGENQGSPLATDKAKHTCVAWEPLEHWAAERSFDAFTPGLLVHPSYGKLFGDDYKGDPLGIVAENYPLSGQHGAVAHGER
ncbi:hypothetical protein G6514_010202 [Epicoccum nigrum]|nr:hypothetical protein G6514_010202 [Epicoccum nigrum]